MEDDKIKQLFSGFDPELSPSSQFMIKLQRNMEIVECVKQQNMALKKRHKLAAVIAAACGFVMGIILTLLFPLVDDLILTFSISLPQLRLSALTIDCSYVGWGLMAFVSIITALNAYEIALAKLTPAGNRQLSTDM